jgi:hypothetical protein
MNFKKMSILTAALMFVAVSILLPSCAKEGPQGIPGPQGQAGPAGPAGDDGSVIYSGNGAPSTNIGQNGDYYLDRSTGNLYGPKTSNGWGTPITLGTPGSDSTGSGGQGAAGPQGPPGAAGPRGPAGPTGAAGASGSQIFSGNGAPAANLGNNGDYYLDKTNYFLYGPKTSNGWGTPTLLRGAQGPQGPAGPSGVAGSQIFSGTGAPAANLGNIGDYYLDKSNVNFYGPKTANGWGAPISLNGGTGSQGPAGPQGPQGPQGPAGPAGPQGSTGATGAAGAAGAAGSQIFSGTTAPPAATGKTGDYYIDDMHAILYGPKTAAGWPATGLALGVNNVITYDFVDKVTPGLPYNWVGSHDGPSAFSGVTYIWLPYNNAAAQTTGFTIPQAIVNDGIVMSYIRYFTGPPSDTATTAGMTPWWQMPYSMTYSDQFAFGVNANAFININILTSGVGILLSQQNDGNVIDDFAEGFAATYVPAEIRFVLIPSGQINTIQNYNPNLQQSLPGSQLRIQ